MLLEQQRAFRQAVFDGQSDKAKAAIAADAIGRDARLDIYRNNAIGSLIGVLRAAYPVIDRLVGSAYFNEAAGRFACAHPPKQPQLSRYGGGFAGFLEQTPAAGSLPYLGDVARLEWARIEVYFAADAPSLHPSALAEIEPGTAEDLRFIAHPGARLIASRHPVHSIWAVNQAREGAVAPVDLGRVDLGRGEAVLVLRRGMDVRMYPLDPAEYAFLQGLFTGQSLGTVAAKMDPGEDGKSLQDMLAAALARGAFTQFQMTKQPTVGEYK